MRPSRLWRMKMLESKQKNGHGLLHESNKVKQREEEPPMTHPRAYHKRLQRARQKRTQQAKQRCLHQVRERLRREQALQELGLPETVAEAVQWRLQAQQKLLGKVLAMMFPPRVWRSQLPGAVPGPGLGEQPPWSHPGRVAAAAVGQAPAAPGAGAVGPAVAAPRGQKLGDPQSVAMDVGGG